MRSDGDDDDGARIYAAPDHPGLCFYLFFIYFLPFFLRRWMVRLILARWIQLDPHALDLFYC
jgi:hypothetical protein